MRISAYVLAADPAWIELSVRSYYDVVDKIIVCYDKDSLGWTGIKVPVGECIERLRAIDVHHKMRLVAGSFYRSGSSPMENGTNQRQCALAVASEHADWVLELDTDEVVPDAPYLVDRLSRIPNEYQACFWPMRVIFKQIGPNQFLEVCTRFQTLCWEYPGPVACRPGVELIQARRTTARAWTFSLRYPVWRWLSGRPVRPNAWIDSTKIITHFSWARSTDGIIRKVKSWGHSRDFDTETYVREVWGRADVANWRGYREFHPIQPRTWPALRLVTLGGGL